MHGGKRGLVAPQNTFLENIVRRSSGEFYSERERMDVDLASQSKVPGRAALDAEVNVISVLFNVM